MEKCCVCGAQASYEVRLYDVYPVGSGLGNKPYVFDEQDYTCPFLCEAHKQINESRAVGTRQPRGYVEYPYTNQHGAQGWTKYRPVKSAPGD